MYRKPEVSDLVSCMQRPECIRNVCILAHVDHGKTTIADSLLATNLVMSKRLAGTLRFLDDRMDEIQRGITMKSSAVSLLNTIYNTEREEKPFLLNLIDTPGHIDFSSEVSAALRVCDGALIVVDLVEGVCVQTREAIRQAYTEKCKMILLLNKFDRLVLELGKTLVEIFEIIRRAVEDCNAIIAELYRYEHNVDIEDSGLLFSPDTGNVIFASAIDGWGFTLERIASTFLGKIKDETLDSLTKKLWNFDAYVDTKHCTIKLGATEKCKTNLFIQLCLKTIHEVYQTIVTNKDKDKTKTIAEKLKVVGIPVRDLNHSDAKVRLKAVMQGWSPLAETILCRCWTKVPAPSQIEEARVRYLLDSEQCSEEKLDTVDGLVEKFLSLDVCGETVVYVSKMFCVDSSNLSQNKPKMFVPKPRIDRGSEQGQLEENRVPLNQNNIKENVENESDSKEETKLGEEMVPDFEIIALARVFTGTLRPGQEVYVRTTNSQTPKLEKISNLYILFGKDMIQVEEVKAGNVCGIGGMRHAITRTATLSTSIDCVPFIENVPAPPVVRNSIEPVNPVDLPKLRQGLQTLMQSDSCVQVLIEPTGEHVLLTAGDVHLAKCMEDLVKKFAKIEVNVSNPMVSVRETVSTTFENKSEFRKARENSVDVEVKGISLTVAIVGLPEALAGTLERHYKVLHGIEEHQNVSSFEIHNKSDADLLPSSMKTYKRDAANVTLQHTKDVVMKSFDETGKFWSKIKTGIWSIGKTSNSINLLVNATDDHYHRNIFETLNETDRRSCFDHFVVNAFHTFCKSGPLCEEPLQNCVFLIKKFSLLEQPRQEDSDRSTTYSVNIESSLSAAFKQAFAKQSQRIMEPMFATNIEAPLNILGSVYKVINKRQGKVLESVGMDFKEQSYLIKAQIPVVESTGFAAEILNSTGGKAIPNLKFSHFEIIDGDPFYEPAEDDEEEEGVNVDLAKRATKLRKDIRRRKGLFVDDQVVVHAEKQRTLNKKK